MRLEPLFLAAVVPIFWFPFRWPALTLLGLLVIPLVWLWRLRQERGLGLSTDVQWPLLGVLLATTLTTIPIFDPRLAVPKVLGIALGAGVLSWTVRAVQCRSDLLRAAGLLALLVLGLSTFGLVGTEWTSGKNAPMDAVLTHLPQLVRGVVPNTTQGGVNPNELAGDLVLCLPILLSQALALWLRRESKSLMVGLLATAAAGCLVLLATQSRGALAGLGVAFATLGAAIVLPGDSGALLHGRGRKIARIAYAASVLAMIAITGYFVARSLRSTDAALGIDSLTGRQQLWGQALLMLRDFPITGIGLGQFDPVLHLLYLPSFGTLDFFVPHAHNMVLAYGVELGAPGLAAFALLFAACVRHCLRAWRSKDPMVRWSGLGIALGLLAFLVFGLTDAIAPGARGGLLLWAVLGAGAATGGLRESVSSVAFEHD